MHPHRPGIVPALQGKHWPHLQTGPVGGKRPPLWGHMIPQYGVDIGPEPTGCQQLQPPPRAKACNLGLCLALWTHLGIVQRKLVLRAFEDSFTVKGEGTGSGFSFGKGEPRPHSPPQPGFPPSPSLDLLSARPQKIPALVLGRGALGPVEADSCLRQHLANRWRLVPLPPGGQLDWKRTGHLHSTAISFHWLGGWDGGAATG